MDAPHTFAQAYDLLRRYGYPSLVVIFSCIVLFGKFSDPFFSAFFRWLLGWSLYLCVSSRMYSASYYLLGFSACAVVFYFVLEYLPQNIWNNIENTWLSYMIVFFVAITTILTMRFTVFRKFTISQMQLFISSISMFLLADAIILGSLLFFFDEKVRLHPKHLAIQKQRF